MPSRTPLNAVVHSPVERDDYTVSRVYFESFPGHYVTGSLYRPKEHITQGRDKLPAVLCPHGHWGGGRFHAYSYDEVAREIAQGADGVDVEIFPSIPFMLLWFDFSSLSFPFSFPFFCLLGLTGLHYHTHTNLAEINKHKYGR